VLVSDDSRVYGKGGLLESRAAPGRLVMPPRTAAAKAFIRGSIIMGGSRTVRVAMNIPATAPMKELRAQVKEKILLVRIPISRATSRFCWVALMAVPSFVYRKKRKRMNIRIRQMMMVQKLI